MQMVLNLVNCKDHGLFISNARLLSSRRFPLRREVESCNNSRLNALASPERTYHAVDSAGYDVYDVPISGDSANQLLDRLIAVSRITLKVSHHCGLHV